jgi:hypothetical protein
MRTRLGRRQPAGAIMSQVDPWEKAADCVRALAATNEPTKREILTNVRNLWMGLAEQHSFMSDFELAKQIEVIGRIHSGLRGA